MSSIKEKLASLPLSPGVYLFKDKQGVIVYVGKAKSLRQRVASYFTKAPDIKTQILLDRLYDINYEETASEMEALLLEDQLIKKYKPRYNVSLRDDKAYPFLKLTIKEEWPRLFLVRQRKDDGALYFGPYQGGMVREVIRLLKKLFPIRWCRETPLKMREQPCLYYRLESCAGPCIGAVSHDEYLAFVAAIAAFLRGQMPQALDKLKAGMRQAAAQQDFERAAYLRDRLDLLLKMMEGRHNIKTPAARTLDNVAALKQALKLKRAPLRIEAFDISNIQGTNVVGSLVVFFEGTPFKSDYRRFKIRGQKANDVAAIYEVVRRRYAGKLASKLPVPDLIVVDGGLGQVNAAKQATAGSVAQQVPIIGLAKREETIYFPRDRAALKLPRRSVALKFLQRVRDEVHRFSVAYHRQRRAKSLFAN